MKAQIISFVFIAIFSAISVQAESISTSWQKTKNKLYKSVHNNYGVTFYVGCEWKNRKVDLESCGLQDSFGKNKRRLRTEAEHIWPISYFYKSNSKYRQCYYEAKKVRGSTRKYCFNNDINYKMAHNDLINLRVSVGAINQKRSNKPFSNRSRGENHQTFSSNGKSVLIDSRVVVPASDLRGDIARIGFYMIENYGLTLSKRQLSLIKEWHELDPISQDEIIYNKAVHKAQGKSNRFVSLEQ